MNERRIRTDLLIDVCHGRIKPAMKKTLSLSLEDDEIIELMRILMDDDAGGALIFLKSHFKGRARDLLEGG